MCKGPEAGPCLAGWSGMRYGMREEGRAGRAQGGRAGLGGWGGDLAFTQRAVGTLEGGGAEEGPDSGAHGCPLVVAVGRTD